MRQRENDEIELVDGKGSLAKAHIRSIEKKKAEVVVSSITKEQENPRRFSVAIANLKPASLEFAVEKLTELGAFEISIFKAIYSEKEQVSNHTKNRLNRHLISALKQSGRLFLPKLSYIALEDILQKKCFFCDLDDKAEKLSSLIEKEEDVTIIIGPESGWHEKEKKILLEKATVCLLNPNILRAETAAITSGAIASQMLY